MAPDVSRDPLGQATVQVFGRRRWLAAVGLLAVVLSLHTSSNSRQVLAIDVAGPNVLEALPLAKLRSVASRAALLKRGGGNAATERAVAAALDWIARHQSVDGTWSLTEFSNRCKDGTCVANKAASQMASAPAATAMGLLPLLAAGHSHKTEGPYRKIIQRGLVWLVKNQQPNGDLASGVTAQMYSHGLASLALCDAFAMTADPEIGRAAQKAIDFIEAAQDPASGGWRYVPRQGGDTCVLGWQLMALEVGRLGGLKVKDTTLDGARKWLRSVAQGDSKGKFSYVPGSGPSASMTAVGLLASQHLGMKPGDPAMLEGARFLKGALDQLANNIYTLYYVTQALHQLPGKQWDESNATVRTILVNNQERGSSCAAGSWSPVGNTWGAAGGRLMVTSFSCLTLEVYYRYPRLYEATE